MPATDDIYALESWLREKALEAHNKRWANKCKECPYNLACVVDGGDKLQPCAITGIRDMANETIAKIQNARASQRPHVTITEEFDVR